VSTPEAQRWLEFATEDLAVGDLALSQSILRQACFHAQQAVEKALKGLLVARSGTYPKSHSLEQLLLMPGVSEDERQRWQMACRRLDEYYLPARYADALPPGAMAEPTRDEAGRALGDAKAIVEAVRERMGGAA